MNIIQLARDAGMLVVLERQDRVCRIPKRTWDPRRLSAFCPCIGVDPGARTDGHGGLRIGTACRLNVAVRVALTQLETMCRKCGPVGSQAAGRLGERDIWSGSAENKRAGPTRR